MSSGGRCWTGVSPSNNNNNGNVHRQKKRPSSFISCSSSMRRALSSNTEEEDSGEVKFQGGWNTLDGKVGVLSSAGADPRSRDPRDGWASEDPEPSPPPPPRGQPDEYERDASGRMVYVPRGFYYDGVRPDDPGDRIKVDVGVVGARRSRMFVLRKVLSSSSSASDIVSVTMERPLGIVFERDTEGMVRVADFVEGSRAGRAAAVDRLQSSYNVNVTSAKRGDVLRAFTTTTLSFGPRAQLLGDLSGTKRAVVLFGCDDQPWNKVVGALKAGLVADGPVTLLLERERDEARANAWTPEELDAEYESVVAVESASAMGQRKALAAGAGGAVRRRRVEDETNVPDAINGAYLVSGISFLLLIFAGFNP